MRTRSACALLMLLLVRCDLLAASYPVRARRGMVVSESAAASRAGVDALRDGGNAVDAAVAAAVVLSVTCPIAGNIGGGGFLLLRTADGKAVAYDFREAAPEAATPTMFMKDGVYSPDLHHRSPLAIGVPGTVAGLHAAWKDHGRLPWGRLVRPAIAIARNGFVVTDRLSRTLREAMPDMKRYPASLAAFTREGTPYEIGDLFRQPDLARTLSRIADRGPSDFYEGRTAELIVSEMKRIGGLITLADLKAYRALKRAPVRGSYRGIEVIGVPPPGSGGVAVIEMLNILEGYDLKTMGFASAAMVHHVSEAMRRAFADRARWLGDPDFVRDMPIERLISKDYAASLRRTIDPNRASRSSPTVFEWSKEPGETTHVSVVDADRNAVSLTYTLEQEYGSKIVVPGAGFLLNNEMGDFNPVQGETTEEGRIGTEANLAAPGKRMLSSMSPTILARDGKLFMVTGSPGGRSIISTVLLTILDVADFGMNVQEAVDAPRFHHQWLPDRINYETWGLSADTLDLLLHRGHTLNVVPDQGVAEAIVVNGAENLLEGGCDRRRSQDGAAIGF